MRTNLYPATIALLFCIHADAQSPDWVWANRAGGSGTEDAYATTTDADGNVYVTGYFTSGSITFGSTTLTNAAYEDIFLVKYNSAGNALWARAATGPGYDEAMNVTTDTDGNVIIVGFFTSASLTFGSNTITNTGTYYNGFIAKYDPDGNALWAHNIGGDALEHFYAVAADAQGNIYAAGDLSSSSITFGSSTLTHVAYADALLAKYDADGNELWAVSIAGDFGDQATSVAADADGNALVAGQFASSVLDLDGGTLNNGGSTDGFLAKYNGDGIFQWAKAVSGAGSEYITGVAVDGSGNMAITGSYSSEALIIGSTTLSDPSGLDLTFIAKYGSGGAELWALTGADGANYGTSIAADPNDDFVVAGYWEGEVLSFGGIHFDPGASVADIYVVKCSGSGSFLWATTAGSDGQDQAVGVSTDDEGSVIVAGWFSGTDIAFGSTTLVNDPGSDDLFVAKLNGSVGIHEGASARALTFFPNPANDRLVVRLPAATGTARVTINDLQGRTITSSMLGAGSNRSLDVSGLRPGAYELVVAMPDVVRAGRFVIAR